MLLARREKLEVNKNDVKETAGLIVIALTVIGTVWMAWKDARDPDSVDHLTRQPDGRYK